MNKEDLTFKIEILGHLLSELEYWGNEDFDLVIADQRFDETLTALKEIKAIVLFDLEEYFKYARDTNEPIYLPFVQIYRELKNAKFGE